MKKTYLIVTMVAGLILSACGGSSTPEAIPTVIINSGNSQSNEPQPHSGDSVTAEAIVVPITDAQLSFTAIGRVTNVNVEVGDVVQAGDVLVELDTSVLAAKVHEAEANLAFAKTDLEYLIRLSGCPKGVNCTPSYQHIEAAENSVASAQAMVDSANAVLASQSNLTAPFDGTVVSVDIAPYETVTPGLVVIVLGDLSSFKIETTDLSERDVSRVRVEQDVIVFIDALGSNIDGRVVDIDRISSTLGGDVVYTVTIELNEQPEELRWGMSASVEILAE